MDGFVSFLEYLETLDIKTLIHFLFAIGIYHWFTIRPQFKELKNINKKVSSVLVSMEGEDAKEKRKYVDRYYNNVEKNITMSIGEILGYALSQVDNKMPDEQDIENTIYLTIDKYRTRNVNEFIVMGIPVQDKKIFERAMKASMPFVKDEVEFLTKEIMTNPGMNGKKKTFIERHLKAFEREFLAIVRESIYNSFMVY